MIILLSLVDKVQSHTNENISLSNGKMSRIISLKAEDKLESIS